MCHPCMTERDRDRCVLWLSPPDVGGLLGNEPLQNFQNSTRAEQEAEGLTVHSAVMGESNEWLEAVSSREMS